jgi:ribonucrease Y
MSTLASILIFIGAVVTGLVLSVFVLKNSKLLNLEKKQETAAQIKINAKEVADKILNETKDSVEKRSKSIEQDYELKRERLKKRNNVLNEKEGFVKKKEDRLKEAKLKLASFNESVQATENAIKGNDKKILEALSARTGSGVDTVKREILDQEARRLKMENQERLAKMEESLKEDAEKTAKKHIINVIQRLCSPTSVETRAVSVRVPKDHSKGKIVGKNGENIAEFERLLDVDVVFNDLPNTISLSAFRLVERRVAQKTMEKLVRIRGDINKDTVRRCVEEARKEMGQELYVLGSKALKRLNIENNNKKFAEIVGRLQYRTSYGQNIMKHSMEVGWVAAMLGSEIGLDVKTCKVGGFLHDLGKAIDQDPEIDKPHDLLSKDLMEEYGFSWEEVHAAWTHHDAIPQETPEAVIVKAADAISAGRPGARQESFEKYVERMKALQRAAESYKGVKKAYTLSAGREVRVFVESETVNDKGIQEVAKDLAQTIEDTLAYPGQIKVNVIRRTKHTAITK